jgi:hypothetical protein
MIYELFLEGQLVDIRQDLGMQLSFNIDDVNKYGSRDTSFSKTIVLPGTAKNNKILGFVGELGSNNPYLLGNENIGVNFNVAQTTKAELRANGLLLLKGVFRLTGIVKERDMIEYEGNLFGELGGFIAAIGADKLEDLNFSEYNHTYTRDNIVKSWGDIVKTKLITFTSSLKRIRYSGINDSSLYVAGQTITISGSVSNNGVYTIVSASYSFFTGNTIIVQESIVNETVTCQITIPGTGGYYYPLIDYGTYSTPEKNPGRVKVDYDYRTFRPALFVKEYIDKMFEPTGYTYESSFFDSAFFSKLIVPSNTNKFERLESNLLLSNLPAPFSESDVLIQNRTVNINLFDENINGITRIGNTYRYDGINTKVKIKFKISGEYQGRRCLFNTLPNPYFKVQLKTQNNNKIWEYNINLVSYSGFCGVNDFEYDNAVKAFSIDFEDIWNIETNEILEINTITFATAYTIRVCNIVVDSEVPIFVNNEIGDNIVVNEYIPKNILQKDFFVWIMKMFNLYITEDKVKEKHLLIEPYVDYYDLSESKDWTYKVARDKAWNIKPMGMLNGRFFEYKYKDDNDFYNEGYKKKYNIPYGSRLEDTSFQFAKDKQTIEIGFSPSVLIQYQNTDKVVTAIYKKSSGNAVDQEERMDSNIRIMMAKKMTGVASWYIRNNDAAPASANLGAALTVYGYAGHFDDPVNPTKDINFGAASEIYFDPVTYPSTNLFNDYWSGYIAEIADKDSKLLTCHVYLTDLDIAQLDFSKPVFIDGVLWRINKVMDFDATSGELTKVELLKVINNG